MWSYTRERILLPKINYLRRIVFNPRLQIIPYFSCRWLSVLSWSVCRSVQTLNSLSFVSKLFCQSAGPFTRHKNLDNCSLSSKKGLTFICSSARRVDSQCQSYVASPSLPIPFPQPLDVVNTRVPTRDATLQTFIDWFATIWVKRFLMKISDPHEPNT